MNYTKILMSASVIAFVAALAYGGTQAFFSDDETSAGNTFAAGAIDLLIDNSSYGFDWNDPDAVDPTGEWGPNPNNSWALSDLTNQLFFSFIDLKPGDYGEDTISLHVNDNDAYACMAFDLTGTPENGQNEPEAGADDSAGADEGELQNYLSFLFWNDDGDNVLEVGEDIIEELSGLPGTIFSGNWLPIAEAGDAPLVGDTTEYIGKGWCFGEMVATPAPQQANASGPTPGNTGFTCSGAGDHNDAQTDGIVVDVAFHAVQSRNNDDFLCSSLPPLDGNGTTTPPVATSTLTLLKNVVLATSSLSTTTDTDFILQAAGPVVVSGVEGNASTTNAVVTPGAYTLSELNSIPGFNQTGLECIGEGGALAITGSSTVTVAAGDTVTCTFTNTEEPLVQS